LARQSAAWRTGGVGSATLPIASLYASSTGALWVVEIGVTNTTTTAFAISLKRLTSTGTQGTAQTVVYEEDDTNFTAKGDPRDVHSANPGLVAGEIRRATIGASAGSGVIFTFGGRGLKIPSGVANGVGLISITGAAQLADVYFSWDS
jgi:hypothetical protein